MVIKKKVKEIVGSFLEEKGFEFRTEKAYTSSANCVYTRKCGTIMQTIGIGKSNLGKEIGFSMQTDAWGFPFADPRNIIPELAKVIEETKKLSIIHMTTEMIKAISISDYSINERANWPYESEEELEKALREIREVIEKYGLDALERLSVEEEIIPTNAMGIKLFSSYQELNEKYITQNQINVNDETKKDVSEWFDVIREKMTSTQHLPYEQVQNMLVEIAAFLGEQLRSRLMGKWVQGVSERIVFINEMNTYIVTGYFPLTRTVEAWKNQDVDFLKEEYLFILGSKMPLTETQMIELQRRQQALYDNRKTS